MPPIYKSRNAEDHRVYAEKVGDDEWKFTETRAESIEHVYTLDGEAAAERIQAYRWMDVASFAAHYGRKPSEIRPLPGADTGFKDPPD